MKTIKELVEEMRFPNIESEAVLTQTREVLELIDELSTDKIYRIAGRMVEVISKEKLKARIEG